MRACTWKRHQCSPASEYGSIKGLSFEGEEGLTRRFLWCLAPGLLTATVIGIAHLVERLAQDFESGLAELIKVYTIVAAHKAFNAKKPGALATGAQR
ncbi:hypothetical protein CAZ10_09075 [Pseudomonas aeruginosa]|uniref:Uncharacterized protein n=1 Tax=Pseudomonas aeruginosa TaxID=287 RepID=A0A241XR62_PSEAI|nr:hypothetical protein A9513_016010 [Pseudomonas sp. AU12215]OTI62991.1 hypothetical protein CAZ10_09075 [Pseudomonas aeruginosa]